MLQDQRGQVLEVFGRLLLVNLYVDSIDGVGAAQQLCGLQVQTKHAYKQCHIMKLVSLARLHALLAGIGHTFRILGL